jgi:protein-L-isoaspartate O-methyltransferase
LEDILSTVNEAHYRQFVVEQAALQPDDVVPSAGCGPGYETAALAEGLSDRPEAVVDRA